MTGDNDDDFLEDVYFKYKFVPLSSYILAKSGETIPVFSFTFSGPKQTLFFNNQRAETY